MKRQNPSIFNDIVGPIMVGPSSSHTCAPSRIGYLSQQVLSSPLKKALIEFAKEGAYTNMYKGQRSDMGFINGLMGYRPEDPRLRDAFKISAKKGLTVDFIISDYEATVPNISKLTLTGQDGEIVEVYADSTGGGTVKLLKINGFDTSIVGDCYELLIQGSPENFDSVEEFLQANFKDNEGYFTSTHNNKFMINIKFHKDISHDVQEEIRALDGVEWVKLLDPVLVVKSNRNISIPYVSAEDLQKLSNETGKSLWELGVEYEMERSGWTRAEVIDYMKYVVETMESGVKEALKGDINMNGILQPTAGKISNYIQSSESSLDMGVLATAVPWAMATMEYSSAMGGCIMCPNWRFSRSVSWSSTWCS